MPRIVEAMERHQVALYLAAIVAGGVVGWLIPGSAPVLSASINPILGLLLFATFLGVPLTRVRRAFSDVRFLTTVLFVNFLVVPVVVFGLSRFVAGDKALLVGVLLVLLTPCVDYVIVFTGLAGGSKDGLLAATPLLMLLQILLLPLYLLLFAGPETVALFEVAPFLEAFLFLIVLPMLAAAGVQWLSRRARAGRIIEATMQSLMVPLMMATLAVVIGSQVAAVGSEIASLLSLIPLYVAFLVIMVLLGLLAGRASRLDVPGTRALIFSGATRNSLVVLPLALALPVEFALAPLAVVTQTLVELLGMVVLIRVVPAFTGAARAAAVGSAPDRV
ncbi:arsenic resistance protein [Leifsonia sp. Root4]|uniref:arsenic resistance protein n=1 Tax=Leifsonia sp. Root4 TaxID=1736525 RepID=UPI0006F3C33D|nr:bile acid:sodium symporter [Leifsonia sp. Root4]KQW06624.1 arsenic resistance protein [Leifsonia sp. Root4]